MYVPSCTWSNHWNVLKDAGVAAEPYSYLDASGLRLDWAAALKDLEAADDGSVVLLHLCAHNPSGVDPTREQWETLAELCAKKGFLPVFDSAYLGFASGDGQCGFLGGRREGFDSSTGRRRRTRCAVFVPRPGAERGCPPRGNDP